MGGALRPLRSWPIPAIQLQGSPCLSQPARWLFPGQDAAIHTPFQAQEREGRKKGGKEEEEKEKERGKERGGGKQSFKGRLYCRPCANFIHIISFNPNNPIKICYYAIAQMRKVKLRAVK